MLPFSVFSQCGFNLSVARKGKLNDVNFDYFFLIWLDYKFHWLEVSVAKRNGIGSHFIYLSFLGIRVRIPFLKNSNKSAVPNLCYTKLSKCKK